MKIYLKLKLDFQFVILGEWRISNLYNLALTYEIN